MKNIINTINKLLQGEFTKLDYDYYNILLYGYSEKYSEKIFIKLFPISRYEKYINEFNTVKYSDYYIDNFKIENFNVLVLKYLDLFDIDSSYFNKKENINELAILLANFHKNNNPDILKNNDNIVTRIKKVLDNIANIEEYPEIITIWNMLKINSKDIFDEYNHSKSIIHGDIWIGNIKVYNDKLILIDFERSKNDIYYLDFIKLFYEEFDSDKNKINYFLKSYYNHTDNKPITKELELYLLFYVGIGILSFNTKFYDMKFRNTGLKMIKDVKALL